MRLSALVLALFGTTAIGAAERPYANEDSSYTVEPGHFAIELTPLTYARHSAASADEVGTEAWSFGYSLVRAGLARHTEIGVAFEAWHSLRTLDPVHGTHEHGAGCVSLRLKQNLIGNDGGAFSLALAPYLRLPTGSGLARLDRPEWGLALPADFAISENWSGLAVIYADWLVGESGTGHHAESSALLSFSRTLSATWSALAEIYYQTLPATGSSPVGTVDVGLGRTFSTGLYVELGAMVGLTRAADDVTCYVTFAQRF